MDTTCTNSAPDASNAAVKPSNDEVLAALKDGEVSPYRVMQSHAGHYVGTYIQSDGYPSPHSRVSDYMSRDQAQTWLDKAMATQSL